MKYFHVEITVNLKQCFQNIDGFQTGFLLKSGIKTHSYDMPDEDF